MKKKYISIGIILSGLLFSTTLYAAGPDPLNTLINILAKSLGLQNQLLEEIASNTASRNVLGNTGSRGLRVFQSASATTSPTYFGWTGGVLTATTSLLTVGCDSTNTNRVSSPLSLADIDSVGLFLQGTASSSVAQIFIQPQISNDCIDWYDMASIYDQVTTAGSAVNTITLPTASSTSITWTPTNLTTQRKNILIKNLSGRAIRFNVSAGVASSSLWMQATAVERVTR